MYNAKIKYTASHVVSQLVSIKIENLFHFGNKMCVRGLSDFEIATICGLYNTPALR